MSKTKGCKYNNSSKGSGRKKLCKGCLGLKRVASQVFISPCYLSVIFKKETNITFKNYLIQTRIEKAKELLEKTDLKIYDIAEKVGYNNTRYFSELFQRICGKTPSQYRASHNPSMPQDI